VVTSADRLPTAATATARCALTAGAAIGLAFGTVGCVSTEQKATWAHIVDARIIASQRPTIVTRPGGQIAVTRVSLIRQGSRVAIAVSLSNRTGRVLNDIPISVGIRMRGGARRYLNRAAGLGYFQNHLAAIPARGRASWVFTARRVRRVSGRPFAVAGRPSVPPVTVAHTLPSVRAVLTPATEPSPGGRLRITVTNRSGVPQVQLPVYAVARSAHGDTAAGSATVANLGAGQSATTDLHLVGRAGRAPVQIEALPTLF
jgi:hypothetical protein